ncbi:MAG: pyruvate formate lyase-activating protein [Youngiibacter sp.]|jgi:pyruvate formate lyase activating enzyme|nr:pyruvate formate lyase-activating protein [Youngiibacter sp.]
MKGRIHSMESMGLVDGPGIRVVVFLQGCKLRCLYCHNPDTWLMGGGELIEAADLVKKIKRFKPYFEKSGGGVTFSGGEPLMQPEFLLECLKLCRQEGIHTVIDTAGYGFGEYTEILEYTDMVLFDMKHIDPENYMLLTGRTGSTSLRFLEAVQKAGVKMWIRHVVVPGITDGEEHIRRLADKLKPIRGVIKVELLPYHTLGQNKYEEMHIKYKLDGVEPMDKERCNYLTEILFEELGEDYYLESNK